jgi:hypothetical protein
MPGTGTAGTTDADAVFYNGRAVCYNNGTIQKKAGLQCRNILKPP